MWFLLFADDMKLVDATIDEVNLNRKKEALEFARFRIKIIEIYEMYL